LALRCDSITLGKLEWLEEARKPKEESEEKGKNKEEEERRLPKI